MEKMLIFIECEGAIQEILRVTPDQYKVIKHLTEGDYFKKEVRIYTEETLECILIDFT